MITYIFLFNTEFHSDERKNNIILRMFVFLVNCPFLKQPQNETY